MYSNFRYGHLCKKMTVVRKIAVLKVATAKKTLDGKSHDIKKIKKYEIQGT